MFPPAHVAIPAITGEQMRQVDEAMVEEFQIDLARMMENAGRNVADVVIRRFAPSSVTVLAGTGGNGGGGLVAARHLWNRGIDVVVTLSNEESLKPIPRRQHIIAERIGIPIEHEPRAGDIIVDALIGYSLAGPPRGRTADLIDWCRDRTVVSLDNPSGLDVTTGVPETPCVIAAATVTLALPKTGLMGASHVGELYLADISIPPELYNRLGAPRPFTDSSVIRIR